MELNDEQKKYFSYLQEKIIPTYFASNNNALKVAATNLEWNAKKFLGEVPGESIDTAEYVRRTRYDFTMVLGALPEGDESRKFAEEVLERINSFFGLENEKAPVDILDVLGKKAAENNEKLDWQSSVVDLCKLVGLDSSSSARKDYALALGFPADKIDDMPSAEVNMWLHCQLLSNLAANSGEVPESLKTATA